MYFFKVLAGLTGLRTVLSNRNKDLFKIMFNCKSLSVKALVRILETAT